MIIYTYNFYGGGQVGDKTVRVLMDERVKDVRVVDYYTITLRLSVEIRYFDFGEEIINIRENLNEHITY
jgi:hypothetical protein